MTMFSNIVNVYNIIIFHLLMSIYDIYIYIMSIIYTVLIIDISYTIKDNQWYIQEKSNIYIFNLVFKLNTKSVESVIN